MEIINKAVVESETMIQKGVSAQGILKHLVKAAEKFQGDVVSSILLLDEQGLLRNGASPGLPADYLAAIDGLQPDPNIGTCAAVAATGTMVVTPDFLQDNKWAELKHLPLALGFLGGWSVPIKTPDGEILGTFGTYYRNKREPSAKEIQGIKALADTAAKVLDYDKVKN
jgi:GAF domain-containing protein